MSVSHNLSQREREVLHLVRGGLTNDQIAERLGITSDGAKYHVTQILSKLGVSSRREAVDVYEAQPARAFRWAAIAGAGVIATTVAAIGLFAWAAIDSRGESADITGITPDEVYADITRGATRDGEVLHSTLVTETVQGGISTAPEEVDLWIDAESDTVRKERTFENPDQPIVSTQIFKANYVFSHESDSESPTIRLPYRAACLGLPSSWLSVFLPCDAGIVFRDPAIEAADLTGRSTIVLAWRHSPGTYTGELLIYIDPDTDLPIESHWTVTDPQGGDRVEEVTRYTHEFSPLHDGALALLNPHSIGYGAPGVDETVSALSGVASVRWLGMEATLEDDAELVLTDHGVGPGASSSAAGWFRYNTPEGDLGVDLFVWTATDWNAFISGGAGDFLRTDPCVTPTDLRANDRPVTAYAPNWPLPANGPSTPRPSNGACLYSPENFTFTPYRLLAAIDFGDAVIDVRAELGSDFTDPAQLEAVLNALQPVD